MSQGRESEGPCLTKKRAWPKTKPPTRYPRIFFKPRRLPSALARWTEPAEAKGRAGLSTGQPGQVRSHATHAAIALCAATSLTATGPDLRYRYSITAAHPCWGSPALFFLSRDRTSTTTSNYLPLLSTTPHDCPIGGVYIYCDHSPRVLRHCIFGRNNTVPYYT